MNKLEIVLPKIAESDQDCMLVDLAKAIVDSGKVSKGSVGLGLGGTYGYGVEFENDVFIMKPYCWCMKGYSCIWCMMNDPIENPNYTKMNREIKKRFGQECADWGGAPQFYYKPNGYWVRWHKWIGRGMEYQKDLKPKQFRKIIQHCVESLWT